MDAAWRYALAARIARECLANRGSDVEASARCTENVTSCKYWSAAARSAVAREQPRWHGAAALIVSLAHRKQPEVTLLLQATTDSRNKLLQYIRVIDLDKHPRILLD